MFDDFKNTTAAWDVDKMVDMLQYYDDFLVPTKEKPFYKIGVTDCINEGNLSAIYERALCPWHNHVTIRDDRIPSMLANAVCNCDECNLQHDEDREYKCEEAIRKMPALKRSDTCVNGKFVWKPIYEAVSVACVCARRPVAYLT
jgi:hypothetical protein